MSIRSILRTACCMALIAYAASPLRAQAVVPSVPKFALRKSGLELERAPRVGAFYDVTGRRAAAFGYEHKGLEAWVYPMKLLDGFELSFRLAGYPLDISGADTLARINTRPEATTFTYTHAAFTVRQTIFAPIDEPGLIMLLDVESVLPMTIAVSFRPRLRLSWPAGLMTGNLRWDEQTHAYFITEETKRFVGVVGSPAARDVSVMPYQEEPRDLPARFLLDANPAPAQRQFIPIVIAGSSEGRDKAKAVYEHLLGSIPVLYEQTVAHYEQLQTRTVSIKTPDAHLNEAYAWAKVGVDKGVVTNPTLGTGLVAGYRTSGESERPGFAWFFGRDALWTSFALNSDGDFATTRTALEFLKKFQRADGKIPHEISQSAALIPWFTDYEYPWASADATPLYVIAHADYYNATGDREFLKQNWASIVKAYNFTAATDTDNNGLVENTKFGHGWVEGGGLYPPHEEIYMQGLWLAASRELANLADLLGDKEIGTRARTQLERTKAAMEQTYWLPARGLYAFATKLPAQEPEKADPGPNRERRQARMNELKAARLYDEDTVLPAVPLWFKTMPDERAHSEIEHLGSAQIATDWGARIISNESRLYDPLSYHYGSVWPLFTGWASMAAYNYYRPHIGYQALMANAQLFDQNDQGFVTELLSGDFNAPFGRSSHHQIWSEAMIITPLVRGLLGLSWQDGGRVLRFTPQLPAHWNEVEINNIAAGTSGRAYDLRLTRGRGLTRITLRPRTPPAPQPASAATLPQQLIVTLPLPLDAQWRGSEGGHARASLLLNYGVARPTADTQLVEVRTNIESDGADLTIRYDEGTDVYVEPQPLRAGATNMGLRLLRAHADESALHLSLEGLAGRTYVLGVRTRKNLGATSGVQIRQATTGDAHLSVTFDGPPGEYVRRELTIPLRRNSARRT
ncbi:MAG: amylo-alpha-1,6-glucosidase [Pyrinomonadaceae bacterium]